MSWQSFFNRILGRDPLPGRQDNTNNLGHNPTPMKRIGLRHRGYTKPVHDPVKAKARRKQAAKSQKINRK